MSDSQAAESQGTPAENTQSAPAAPQKKGRRKWYLLGLGLFFVVIAAVYAFYYFSVAQFYASTDDAYVGGNRIQLTPQVAGTVTAVHADDTDLVHAGDTVITLDDTDRRVALEQASAQLASTVRSVHQLFQQVAQQKSTIKQRQTALDQARRDYVRDRRLVKVNAVTRQAFEASRSTYRQDQAAVTGATDKLAEIKAQTDGTTVATHPRVKQAEAQLRNAYLNFQRTHVPSPVTGYVAQRNVQVGQRVSPSNPMLSIVPAKQLWVDANFKETSLASMRIGQPATVYSDLYGSDVTYNGHVAGISAGTGSAFELLPPQNATGNWIKIVRRVPVRIAIDKKSLAKHPLRLGLSMHVSVNLHNTKGALLAQKPQTRPRYQTRVYKRRMAGANAMIQRIVAANDGNPNTQPAANKTADNTALSPSPEGL